MKGVCGLWKSGGSKWLIGSKNCEAIMHRVKRTSEEIGILISRTQPRVTEGMPRVDKGCYMDLRKDPRLF